MATHLNLVALTILSVLYESGSSSLHNITCPYANMILLMYVQMFSCALFLHFNSLHFNSCSQIPTNRCRGFTESFPSLTVSSYCSYSFPFNSYFLQNILYPFFPSPYMLEIYVLLTKQEAAFCDHTKQLALVT